jgi:cell division protein FtsW
MKNSVYFMLLVVIGLISFGLVMLASVSAYAEANQGNPMFFVTRQTVFLMVGCIVCVVMARWDYHLWLRHIGWVAGLVVLLMLLCLVPPLGVKVKGASRWIDLGPVNFQPMEAWKLVSVALIASWLGAHIKRAGEFSHGVLGPMVIVAVGVGMGLMQDDLGSCAMLGFIAFVLMAAAGTRWRYLIPLPVAGFAGLLGVAMFVPERFGRLVAFLDPEAHKMDEAYQVWQALVALGSGGVSGLGLGNSVQKMFYLPESHNDFIFPIIGEELGLIATLTVVLCFVVLLISAGYISCHACDATGMLLGIGVTCLISLQAAMNMMVVTSMMPAKGVGLPFISYGGSNLLTCLAGVGILLNIHRHAHYEEPKKRTILPPVMQERRA